LASVSSLGVERRLIGSSPGKHRRIRLNRGWGIGHRFSSLQGRRVGMRLRRWKWLGATVLGWSRPWTPCPRVARSRGAEWFSAAANRHVCRSGAVSRGTGANVWGAAVVAPRTLIHERVTKGQDQLPRRAFVELLDMVRLGRSRTGSRA
jgi:hypothetical protein